MVFVVLPIENFTNNIDFSRGGVKNQAIML